MTVNLKRITSSIKRAPIAMVITLEVDDDVGIASHDLPERQRGHVTPFPEGVDERSPRGDNLKYSKQVY